MKRHYADYDYPVSLSHCKPRPPRHIQDCTPAELAELAKKKYCELEKEIASAEASLAQKRARLADWSRLIGGGK